MPSWICIRLLLFGFRFGLPRSFCSQYRKGKRKGRFFSQIKGKEAARIRPFGFSRAAISRCPTEKRIVVRQVFRLVPSASAFPGLPPSGAF
jgi:hypothetical protein